jgi:hypothetical protein
MHLHINSPRRLIGTAAIACAAALIPVAALAATTAPTAPAARTPACATSGLVIWLSYNNGAMGRSYNNLNFTNLSGHACTLRGSPGVSAASLRGHQVGRAASGNYTGHVHAVRLANGATATAILAITNVGGGNDFLNPSACRPVTAAGLRVYPPNQFTSNIVPLPFAACSSRTGPVYMSVGVVKKS